MQNLVNTEIITQLLQTIPTLQNEVNKTMEEMEGYLNFLKDEKYQQKENETKEEKLKRTESLLDRIKEIVERRKEIHKNGKETLNVIEEMKKLIGEITESCSKDDENLCNANNETIEEIIEIRRQIMEEKIAPHQIEIEKYRNDFSLILFYSVQNHFDISLFLFDVVLFSLP